MEQQQQQPSNLRILTETYQSFVDSSTSASVSPKESSSLGFDPQDTNNIHRFVTDNRYYRQDNDFEEDSSIRMIRRSFAFDEWDRDDNDDQSWVYHNRGPFESDDTTLGIQRRVFEETLEDIDDELHRAIRRTFAFDEWDDDDDDNRESDDYPNGDRILSSRASFVPIQSDDTASSSGCLRTKSDDEIKTPTARTDASNDSPPMSVFQIPSSPSTLPNTKFDLDSEHINAVTPSPAVPRNAHRIQHPYPLYSHHKITPPATTHFGLDAAGFWYEATDGDSIKANPIKDYNSLRRVCRTLHSSDVMYPPQCESIPRRASAFQPVSPENHNHPHHPSDQKDQRMDNKQKKKHFQQEWIDQLGSLGDTLFRNEEEVFESPTTSFSSGDSFSSTVPQFIMFHKNE